MALTEIIFRITPATIGQITLDASVRENHQASATVTRHPIEAEEGAQVSVSDHVIANPLSITIDGVVSGHPAEILSAVQEAFSEGGKDPVRDAHEQMLTDLLEGNLVTIFTTLKEYTDMVLEQVQVTREAATGNSLHFTASATQVKLVKLEVIEDVKAPEKSIKNGGKKPKKRPTPNEEASRTTFLAKTVDAVGG